MLYLSRRTPTLRLDKTSKGFSLVELLVVVAILAILAAIAIPLFLNQKAKAQNSVLKSDFHNLMMGVESTRQTDGTFGTTESVRAAGVETVGQTTSPSVVLVWPNCAQNGAGTAAERSPGNYVVQGYRASTPGAWVIQSGTSVLTYNSKTQAWVEGGSLYNQLNDATNPCRIANGGIGDAIFYYNASNVFVSTTQ